MVTATRIDNLKNYWYLATHFRNGYQLIRSFRNGPPCGKAVRWNGSQLVHPENRDGFVGTILELWKDRCYTREDFYQPRDGDWIVDAGAHVGLFSIAMALENPRCQILALEPFQENYACLQRNLQALGIDNVSPLHCAVGGEQRTAFMKSVGDRSIDHLLQSTPDSETRSVAVLSLAGILDRLGTDRVAMLKMDVEGAEYDAFAVSDSAILSRFERIAMEYHDNLRPGTLDLICDKLDPTHELRIEPTFDRGYGILLATLRRPADSQPQ